MDNKQDLNFFKDHLWDLINMDDMFDVRDIESNDKEDYFIVTLFDGSKFKVVCSEVK